MGGYVYVVDRSAAEGVVSFSRMLGKPSATSHFTEEREWAVAEVPSRAVVGRYTLSLQISRAGVNQREDTCACGGSSGFESDRWRRRKAIRVLPTPVGPTITNAYRLAECSA